MKILLLTDFIFKKNNDIDPYKCSDRYQMYCYFITKYFKKMNVNVIYYSTCRFGKSNKLQKYIINQKIPYADHAILINKYGFSASSNSYINILKKSITGTLSVITESNVYRGGEDILFYLNPNGLNNIKNTYLLNWINDTEYLVPKKDNKSLNILINQECKIPNMEYINNDSFDIILQNIYKFKNNNKNININVEQICKIHNNEYLINFDDNTSKIKNLIEIYKIYSKSHLYFITHKNVNNLILSELAFSNVVIVAPNNLLNPKTVKIFDILLIDTNNIPWNDITNKLNTVNTHSKMINMNMTWEKKSYEILEQIIKFNSNKYESNDNVKNSNNIQTNESIILSNSKNKLDDNSRIKKQLNISNEVVGKTTKLTDSKLLNNTNIINEYINNKNMINKKSVNKKKKIRNLLFKMK